MTKKKYKVLAPFQGREPGEEFEAELDPFLEKTYKEQGVIEPVKKQEKEGK